VHCEHDVFAGSGCTQPSGQERHVSSPSSWVRAGHAAHALDPALATHPDGQVLQASLPLYGWYLPPGQFLHAVVRDA